MDLAYLVLSNITIYLNHLFKKALVVQTTVDHRAMLSSALKCHTDLEMTNSKQLAQLMVSFKHEMPPRRSLVSKWDLDFDSVVSDREPL